MLNVVIREPIEDGTAESTALYRGCIREIFLLTYGRVDVNLFSVCGCLIFYKSSRERCRPDQDFPSPSLKSIPFKPPQFSNTCCFTAVVSLCRLLPCSTSKESLPFLKHCRQTFLAADKVLFNLFSHFTFFSRAKVFHLIHSLSFTL